MRACEMLICIKPVAIMPPKKIKIAINIGGAAAAAVAPAALDSSIPLTSASEAGGSNKRDRVDEVDEDGAESLNTKRYKLESQLVVSVKAEPKIEEDDDGPLVNVFRAPEPKWEQSWRVKASELLDFMDSQDKLDFFRTRCASGEASVALVRAQLGDGAYDSFDCFVSSLRHVYKSAEQYVGTDVHKQSLKLLEILDEQIKTLNDSIACVQSGRVSDKLPAAEGEDNSESEANSDDDEPMVVNTKEEMQAEIDYYKETFSEDEDERERPRTSVSSTFQDKYENHSDHAHRPFWVCLMVSVDHCHRY
jgi:hypothetical protein